MKHGTLTINFEHYWHCGSGQAGEGDVDLLPVVEECGLPYVPGRAIRGRLKWAAREAGWRRQIIEAMFGKEDARNLDSMGRLHVANGIMRDSFALKARAEFSRTGKVLPEVSALFEDIASTSLNQQGSAEPKTLRRVRYAVPVTVVAEVSLEEDESATWKELAALVGKLRAIGKGKHDGFGWCSAELSANKIKEEPAKPSDSTAFNLELELLDDVVLSANSATVGGHRTLDHVPGSSLMGAFARVFFPALRKKNIGNAEQIGAETLLSGNISFGNGVPIGSGGEATVPVPLSWRHAKDKRAIVEGLVLMEDDEKEPLISNLAAKTYKGSKLEGKQPVQMREGWLDIAAGRLASVARTETLKTAIDPSVGKYETAKESALYGYEAIKKGTRFISRIELKDADAGLCDALREAFDGKIIRLGRSKGTEFGRAKCVLSVATPDGFSPASGEIVLLAESDLALLDETGFPTLEPAPSHFGLNAKPENQEGADGWELCRERSYLRFRRYSLWNAKRGSPDVERQVISKGSVIVFTGRASSGDHLRVRAGFGQTEGLGRVRLENISETQNWMGTTKEEHPHFEKHGSEVSSGAPDAPEAVGQDYLTPWITARHKEKQFDVTANKLARDWCRRWSKARGKVSASQWGRLDDVARDEQSVQKLLEKLGDGSEDRNGRKTITGHGRLRKKWMDGDRPHGAADANVRGSLIQEIHKSLRNLGTNVDDRLALAAFRAACHRMAAEKRREHD